MVRCQPGAKTGGWVRRGATLSAVLGVLVPCRVASAEQGEAEGDCPPGAVCTTEVVPEPEPPVPEGSVTVVLPPPERDRTRTVLIRQRPGVAPDIVSYDGAPETRRDASAHDRANDEEDVNGDTTWGLQIRADGMMLPQLRPGAETPAMGGAGVSLRYRPASPVAIDVGMDVLMGVDSNGYQRREVPLAMSLLLYLVPDTVVQPYAFFGMSVAHASVDASRPEAHLSRGLSDSYDYIGGHAGLGLDIRLATALSLSVDGLGFVRERVDALAERYPEFIDPRSGQPSNTTVAGQLRGGVTFWW